MNIGILTYAGGLNYGAQAQLYAMTNYLKEKGHNITVLMFKPKYYFVKNIKFKPPADRSVRIGFYKVSINRPKSILPFFVFLYTPAHSKTWTNTFPISFCRMAWMLSSVIS